MISFAKSVVAFCVVCTCFRATFGAAFELNPSQKGYITTHFNWGPMRSIIVAGRTPAYREHTPRDTRVPRPKSPKYHVKTCYLAPAQCLLKLTGGKQRHF